MSTRLRYLLLPLAAGIAWPQEIKPLDQVLEDRTPGQEAQIKGEGLSTTEPMQVHLKERATGTVVPPVTGKADATTLRWVVPKDLAPGRYGVRVALDSKKSWDLQGELRVTRGLTLLTIYPQPVYPRGDGRFDFQITGESLGSTAAENVVEVPGRGAVVDGACKDNADKGPCLRMETASAGRKLQVVGFPADNQEKPSLQVRVKDVISNPLPLEMASFSGSQARWWSIAILAGLVALLLGSAWKGLRHHRIGERVYGPLEILFLDQQTNTYSLSKFQILWWITITALGYIYLFLTRTLVQGSFDFPAIPERLPELLAVSAGTTVAVAGLTATGSSKGSGGIHPSLADFITSGGLVVGERFQFVMWTAIAGLGFLALVFMRDPLTLRELPDVPETLLYLTGVSAGGYVGGRLVRKRGPVIKNLSMQVTGGTAPDQIMEFDLRGEGLAKDGEVRIDGKALRAGVFRLDPVEEEGGFCNRLKLTIEKETEPFLDGPHMLTFVNRDGQTADASFPLDPMTIDAVTVSGAKWKVQGKNFGDVEVVSPPDGKAQRVSVTELDITFNPAPASPGTYTLTLRSAGGLRASKKDIQA